MTMPWGSTEEPDEVLTSIPTQPVHVVSSDAPPRKSVGAEHGYWRTFLIANVVNSQVSTPGAVRIASRNPRRKRLLIRVNSGGNVTTASAALPGFPSIATSGTAIQNPNNFPVSVVLAGFTATQVFVNGILVGASNGTYIVPAFGSLSVTFTVVGTTTASTIASTNPQSALDGALFGNRDFIQNSQQVLSPYLAGSGGGFLPIGDNERWECQQELWAAYPPSNTAPVLVTTCDEVYASDAEAYKEVNQYDAA